MAADMFKKEENGDVKILTLMLSNFLHEDNQKLMQEFDLIILKGSKKIVLDLSETIYISSLILASLVYMQKLVKDSGGNLVFCNVKGRVKEILEMTNLDKVFDIAQTRNEAVALFKA